MSYSSAITAGEAVDLHATILFSGIPMLFGTKAGLVLNTSSVYVTAGAASPATLTSVEAIAKDSLKFDGAALNYDIHMVPPSSVAADLRLWQQGDGGTNWNRYFERRRTPQPQLTALSNETSTGPTMSSTSGIVAGDVIYVNREAILVDTVPSSTQITCLAGGRNYCGLPEARAAVHQTGAIVSLSPRYLLGRMAAVHLWASDTDNRLVGYVQLAASPAYDLRAGAWKMTFDDLMRMFDRKIAVGFRGTTFTVDTTAASNVPLIQVTPFDTREFTGRTDDGAIAVDAEDQFIAPIYGHNGSHLHIEYSSVPNAWASFSAGASAGTIRRCYVFTGPPMVCALKVLTSARGDGDNGAYDTLFGVTSDGSSATGRLEAAESECRMGAAIRQGLIDTDTLTGDLLSETVDGWCYVLGAKGEENLLDLLSEVGWALGGFWHINSSGKLSFKKHDAYYDGDTIAAIITHTHLLTDTSLVSVDDESEIVHSVELHANYHAIRGEFLGQFFARYHEEAETFREIGGVVKVERRGLVVDVPGQGFPAMSSTYGAVPADIEAVRLRMDRVYARRMNGTRKYQLLLPARFSTLTPGDRITVTSDVLNAFDGGTVSAMTLGVVKVDGPDMKTGHVVVDGHDVWIGKLISPTAKVDSWNAGNNTATLATNAKYGLGTTPGSYFAAGWAVRVCDYSASPRFATTSQVTILSVTSTTIQFTAAPAFTPAAGDLIKQAGYDAASSTAENSAQTLAQRDYAFMGDANFLLGSSNADADKWG